MNDGVCFHMFLVFYISEAQSLLFLCTSQSSATCSYKVTELSDLISNIDVTVTVTLRVFTVGH